jgi:hypothetical protein
LRASLQGIKRKTLETFGEEKPQNLRGGFLRGGLSAGRREGTALGIQNRDEDSEGGQLRPELERGIERGEKGRRGARSGSRGKHWRHSERRNQEKMRCRKDGTRTSAEWKLTRAKNALTD